MMGIFFLILTILKYIGLILLFLLLLFLILLCAPVRYEGNISCEKELNGFFRVHYILKVIQWKIIWNDGGTATEFKIFGKIIFPKKEERDHKKENDAIKDQTSPYKAAEDAGDLTQTVEKQPEIHIKKVTLQKKEIKEEKIISEKIVKEEQKEAGKEKGKKDKKDNIEEETEGIGQELKQLKSLLHYPDKDLILEHTKKLFVRLFKVLKPKKMHVSGEVGFEDPANTGLFLAAEGVFVGLSGWNLNIQGVFDQQIVSIQGFVKGRVAVIRLFIPLVWYLTRKPVWKIVRGYI